MQMSKRTFVLLVVLQLGFLSAIAYMGMEMFRQEQTHKANVKSIEQKRDFYIKRFLQRHMSLVRKSCQAYMKKEWKLLYNKVWNIHPPCDKRDKLRKVYTVDGLGKVCLETSTTDIIKSRLRENIIWEKIFHPYFRKYIRKGSVVLDVGAHLGTHTLFFSKLVGPRGRVHAFEPQSKMYQELLVNMDLNKISNVVAHFVALGNSHGRVSMAHPEIGNEGGTNVGVGGNRVELRTLDSFYLKNVSFLKLDVEGFEPFVLQGARQTLTRNRPVILIELHDTTAKFKKRKAMSMKILRELGYTKFEPIPQTPIHNFLVFHKSYKK